MIGSESMEIYVYRQDHDDEWGMVKKFEVEKGGIGGYIKSINLEFLREEYIVAVTDKRCIYSAKIKFEDPK